MDRIRMFSKARRIVVKVGTSSITEDLTLSERKLGKLVSEVARVHQAGREVIIVSSGAIAAGIRKLGLKARPRDMNLLQATAAVGQSELMGAYGKAFAKHGITVAQILLTRDDFHSRGRCLRIKTTIDTLLKAGAIPVINENDSVAVEEIKFGDNDTLSATVASNVGADLLVLMSSMDGLHTKDPARSKGAVKIDVVDRITDDILSLKGKSRLGGVGGIESKIKAGKMMMECGIPMAIVDSGMEDVLSRLTCGENVGTLFLPKGRIEDKHQWMLYSSVSRGIITVDDGAARVLSKGKASLLPPGIINVKGIFKKGDTVSVADRSGREFARGMTNFSSEEVEKIMGKQSVEIQKITGKKI
ncbi:MAG: glutamate 5-kinase, partial [Candidatus Altiarchaeota archaeon]